MFQDRTAHTTVRTDANIQLMKQAVDTNNLKDPLDRQISTRWNPVLQPEQRESARKILKDDLGHQSYTIRKVHNGMKSFLKDYS